MTAGGLAARDADGGPGMYQLCWPGCGLSKMVLAAPNDIMFSLRDSAGRVPPPHPATQDQGRKIKWNLNLIPDKA